MIRIGGVAVADYLTINFTATHDRVIHLLQNQYAGALAHHETIAADVKGPRGVLRVIIARAHGSHGGKAGHAHGHDSCLCSSGKNGFGIAHFNRPPRLAKRMGAGGTGAAGGHVGATQSVVN